MSDLLLQCKLHDSSAFSEANSCMALSPFTCCCSRLVLWVPLPSSHFPSVAWSGHESSQTVLVQKLAAGSHGSCTSTLCLAAPSCAAFMASWTVDFMGLLLSIEWLYDRAPAPVKRRKTQWVGRCSSHKMLRRNNFPRGLYCSRVWQESKQQLCCAMPLVDS